MPGAQALEGAWEGNPRDYYSRAVTVTGALGPGVALAGRLGREGAMTPGPPDPAVQDYRTPSLELTSDDARALDLAWQVLARALDAAGYADETLTQAPMEVLRHLQEQGLVERVAALRAEVTAALVRGAAARPGSALNFSFTSPDDWARVLGAVPHPERVTEVSLSGCGLSSVPPALLRFTGLLNLVLSHNRLRRAGGIPAQLPVLQKLWLDGNPLDDFDLAELEACRQLRVLGLRSTSLKAPPKLAGVEVQGTF